jgi:hypothetical protein
MKDSSDNIGNQTRDIPAYSATACTLVKALFFITTTVTQFVACLITIMQLHEFCT